MKVPCYKCDKRYVGCHDGCKEYQEYSAYCKEKREALQRENALDAAIRKSHRVRRQHNTYNFDKTKQDTRDYTKRKEDEGK